MTQQTITAATDGQQSGNGSGFGSIAQGLGIAPNENITGPSQNAYNASIGNAQNSATQFNGLGASAQGRAGATITNPYQAGSQATMNQAQLQNGGAYNLAEQVGANASQIPNTAMNQFQQGSDAAIASNLALANSGRAGSVANAGNMRMAQQQNAVQGQANANQAAILAGQMKQQQLAMQLGSAQAQSGIAQAGGQMGLSQYGLEQQDAQQQAALQQQQQAENDNYGLGLYGIGQNYAGQANGQLNNFTNYSNQAQQTP